MAIVVQPYGQLNREGSAQLQYKLAQLHQTARREHSTWIVDMANIQSVDRDGLVALLAIRRQARKVQRRLLLRNVPKSVRLLFEIAHLDEEFEIDVPLSPQDTDLGRKKPGVPLTLHSKPMTK